METPGRYTITATVKLKQWATETSSAPKAFDIVEGAKLWQQEFGLPMTPGSANAPEVRKYLLQQVNYLKGKLRLYVRITDGYGIKTFKVIPIGKALSFSRPEAQVDESSNLHVLYQNGPTSFGYTKYSPEGDTLLRQTFDYVDSRPRLQMGREREIGVRGGLRRVSASDIPPPKVAEPPSEKPATPAPTNGKDNPSQS